MKKIIKWFKDLYLELGFGIVLLFGFIIGSLGTFFYGMLVMKPIEYETNFELYDDAEFYAIDGLTMLMIKDDILIEVDIEYSERFYSYDIDEPIIYRKYHYEKFLWFERERYVYRIILPKFIGE